MRGVPQLTELRLPSINQFLWVAVFYDAPIFKHYHTVEFQDAF
jgi:hypothetical protein